jgi:tetratricopeptide (TPR) repeat protein
MTFWGYPISTHDLHQELPKADNGGVLSIDVLLAARQRGFDSELVAGDRTMIRESIENGQPLILMLQIFDAPGKGRDLFHYVIVDGFDPDQDLVRVHFGDGETRWVPLQKISSAWADTGFATIRVSPGQRPGGDTDAIRYAVALEEAGHLDEAEAIYLQLLDTDRESGLVWLNLGNVRLERGLTNEAQVAYRRALELEPDQPDALNNLAWLLLESNSDLNQARDLALRAVSLGGPDPYLSLETLGRIHRVMGHCEEAISTFETALVTAPSGSTARGWVLYGLALAQRDCGRIEAARANLKRARLESPDRALQEEIDATLEAVH